MPGLGRLLIAIGALWGASLATTPALAEVVKLQGEAEAEGDTQATTGEASVEAAAEGSAAEGDAAAPAPEPPPEEQGEELPPPAEAKPPDPPKAPPLIQIYGIIKPEVIVSKAVETFGKAMMVAPTAAAHPIADPNFAQIASSFQLQQTRFGIKINDGGPVSGRLEVDFIDDAFSHSSPIQGTGLRLRLAYVTYKPGAGHSIQIGQAWDIFSPMNALTMNMVGNSYQAGNSAFLRPQVVYTYGKGQGIEIAAATGLRAQNVSQAVNAIELGLFPTFALQVGTRMGKNWLGVSGIIGAEESAPPPNRAYNVTVAGNVFANVVLNDKVTVILEGYFGQNTNALGLLTLGSGANVLDVGGFLSGNLKLDKIQALWVTVGASGVLNPADMAVGYTPAVPAMPPAAAVPAARVGIGGMEANANIRATYVVTPLEGLQFYLEPFLFLTRHKLNAADDPTGELANRAAYGTQIGTRYTF